MDRETHDGNPRVSEFLCAYAGISKTTGVNVPATVMQKFRCFRELPFAAASVELTGPAGEYASEYSLSEAYRLARSHL